MNDGSSALTVCDEPVRIEPRIVLVCDSSSAEFQAISFELLTIIPDALYRLVEDVEQLSSDLEHEEFPDLILFVQTWSDEHAFSKLLTLPFIGPFTRLLCVYGPWCGSDGRSRQDWPLALRVPLEHFGFELRSIRSQLSGSGIAASPTVGNSLQSPFIPWTAGRDESFNARYFLPPRKSETPLGVSTHTRLRIHSADRALTNLWRDLFHTSGFHVCANNNDLPHDILIWDADPASGNLSTAEIESTWNMLSAVSPRAKVIVVTGFQIPDEVNRWQSLGAIAVVSKLLPVAALLSEIDRIIG